MTRSQVARRPVPLAILFLFLLAQTPVACAPKAAKKTPRVPVVVATVETRSVPFEMEATGQVEPIRSADVTAQVTGLVTRMLFKEGDEVSAGAVLYQIDPRPFRAAVEQAEAVLARDVALAGTAELEMTRADTLSARGLISAEERDQKRSTAGAARAAVRADSAALISARLDLENATIRAPISGRTGSTSIHAGDAVKANESATPVVTINQIRPINARFTLPQTDLAAVRRQGERELRVDAAPAGADTMWIEGRLVFIDNRVDPTTGTVLLKAEFPNHDRVLWPGTFVRVRLRLYDQKDAIVVPAAAVSNSQSGPYCFVVLPDTTVESRPVTVQRTWRDIAVISNGLKAGETVVTDGQVRLSAGAKAVIRAAATNAGQPMASAPQPAAGGP